MISVLTAARQLAAVVRGEADPATVFGRSDPLPLREAAEAIDAAVTDPHAFGTEHGPEVAEVLQLGREELDRMRHLLRRDDALAALYAAEQSSTPPDVEDLSGHAAALVNGVWEERHDLDRAIGEAAVGWTVARMPPVDRTVLRLALFELLRRPETPVAVVASEAVRLAKAHSTQESGRFVNGVLGELVRRLG